MYYIEVLRTWRVLLRYFIVLAGLYLIAAGLYAIWPWSHVGSGDSGRTYSAGGHAAIVAFVCLLFASISGLSLSRHLDHLDFALTKPRARATFVATVLGVDALGLTVFFIATTIAFVAFHIALGEAHGVVFDAASAFGIALAFGSVLAWYAIVQAVSCARDAAGWALAGVWVAAIGLLFLDAARLGPGLHALVVALNFINPVAYLSTIPFEATTGAAPLSLATHAITIYVVAGVAALVALIRWQRVET
jgi:hypothetical protein